MPVQSVYKKQKNLEIKEKAFLMYQQGLSTREVSKLINKSHTWVHLAVKELSPAKE